MENKLWSDITVQGNNLPRVIEHLFTTERGQLEKAAEMFNNNRPVALAGVASAEYLCMPSVYYLNQHGRFSAVMCASDAAYANLPALSHSNVIINTRSGETAEVVRLAQALVDHGIPFLAITNEPDSTVARLADLVVWSNTHKDELVSINVVTGMMTATLVVCAALTGELAHLQSQFELMGREMAGVVNRAIALSGEFFKLLGDTRPIYLLSRGADAGAAWCGRLVMEEVSRQPGVALGCAEFRQGPNEVIDERFGAALFVPQGKLGDLNLKLAEDIQKSGGRVLMIGPGAQPVTKKPSEIAFPTPALPDFLSPVLEVVPLQLLAYRLAESQGYEPGQVRYITKIIQSEEGIPNQNKN